jgi:hypothetical protein
MHWQSAGEADRQLAAYTYDAMALEDNVSRMDSDIDKVVQKLKSVTTHTPNSPLTLTECIISLNFD